MKTAWRGLVAASLAVAGATLAAGPVFLSPSALVRGPAGVYVAEGGASRIALFDVQKGTLASAVEMPGPVTAMALTADGATLLATIGQPKGLLAVLDVASGKVRRLPVGHTPTGVAVSADGRTAYVCVRFQHCVAVVDLVALRETARVAVLREPIACGLTSDGKRLFVANHLPAGRADGDYTGAVVSVIDTAAAAVTGSLALPNGSTSVRGLCLSPDGAFVYVTHILARYQLPTTQLERGWMNTNALSVIDAASAAYVNTVLLDDVDLGAANPWGVACTADGAMLLVTHAGTHELSIIDRAALHEKLAKVAKGERVSQVSATAEDVPNDLSFLVGIRRRLALAGNGPRAVLAVDKQAYVAEYYSDSLGVVNLDPEVVHRPTSLPLGPAQELTQERQGERNFNDATMCFQHWQSCASCHPDGRADGLNWDLLNDGMGNPKQTKNLLLSTRTPPVMVTGVRETAEKAVRTGMRFIQFAVRPEEDLVPIDAYLRAMAPIPSPYLEDGNLSKAAKRGRKLFEKAGCAHCHPDPLYTDLKKYNVGLGLDRHQDTAFDTPTLVETWRTAPYLYDGRAATAKDLLTTFNKSDSHGRTSQLSEKELADLIEYMLSL
jgi:DNA-binding beta-propeller fold protein YncE